MQNKMIGVQQPILANNFVQNVIPPPLPTDNNNPPPPPPPENENFSNLNLNPNANLSTQNIATNVAQALHDVSTLEQSRKPIEKSKQPTNRYNMYERDSLPSNSFENQNSNIDRSNDNLQSNFDSNNDRFDENQWNNQDEDFRRNNTNNNMNRNWKNNSNNNANKSNNRFNRNQSNFGGNNQQRNQNTSEKTQEEILFEEQYRQWEENFLQWKRDNSNHPDRQRYDDFVSQMEGIRKKLLEKRENLRQNRLKRENQMSMNSDEPYAGASTSSQSETQNTKNTADDASNVDESHQNQDVDLKRKYEMLKNMQLSIASDEPYAGPSTSNQGDTQNTNKNANDIPAAQENISHNLFGKGRNDDSSGGIPGLDLASSDKIAQEIAPKLFPNNNNNSAQSSINVTAILKNPEILSLLSNLKKQQQGEIEPEFEKSNFPENPMHNDDNPNHDIDNRLLGDVRFQNRQQRSDSFLENRPKQNRNDNYSDEPKYSNHFDQDDRDFQSRRDRIVKDGFSSKYSKTEINPMQICFQESRSENAQPNPFRMDSNRSRDSSINMRRNDFDTFQDYSDEFRPVQVIDYQNRRENQRMSMFASQQPTTSGRSHPEEYYTRKIIDYDHKPKTYEWNWFCPVRIIEYDHNSKGYSMHEHPPPKPIIKQNEQSQSLKSEYSQARHQPWNNKSQSQFKQERHQYTPYQRYENRATTSTYQQQSDYSANQPRNQQGKEWIRNYQNAPQNTSGYNRFVAFFLLPIIVLYFSLFCFLVDIQSQNIRHKMRNQTFHPHR